MRLRERFLWIVVVYGALCRLREYLAYRSLWVDEAKFAVKVMDYSYLQMLNPLKVISDPFSVKFSTAGPLGFFYLTKFLTQMLGNNEFILRFFPCISSIIAVFVMMKLVKKNCEPLTVVISVALISIDSVLIGRSADFHPYASDVLVSLILFLLVDRIRRTQLTIRGVFFYVIFGMLAISFSLPSIFVLIGLGVAYVINLCIEKRRKEIVLAISMISLWILSFAFYYFGYIKIFSDTESFPEGGYIRRIADILPIFYNLFKNDPMNYQYWYVPASLLILGCVFTFLRNRILFMYLAFPVLVTLLASVFGKYPFHGRLILFLTPVFIVFIAQGTSKVMQFFWAKAPWVVVVILISLFLDPLLYSAKRLIKPIYREEIRPVIAKAKMLRKAGEPLYVYAYAGPAFHYYAKRFHIDEKETSIGLYHHQIPEQGQTDIDSLLAKDKIWVIYCHVNNDVGRQFLEYLDQVGNKEASYLKPGAGLLLYNFKLKDNHAIRY